MVHARTKLNPGLTTKDEALYRALISSEKDFKKYTALVNKMKRNHPDLNFYGYVSIHARNRQMGLRKWTKDTIDHAFDYIYGNDEQKKAAMKNLKRLKRNYLSALSQKGCTAGVKTFLVDVDTKDTATLAETKAKIHEIASNMLKKSKDTKNVPCTDASNWIVEEFESLHGYHLITYPFNTKLFSVPNVEIKPSSCNPMLFLEYVEVAK